MGYEEQGSSAARQPSRREHLDGITQMTGNLTFGSTNASMQVTITPSGGGTAGTSDFVTAGAVNQLPPEPGPNDWKTSTMTGETLSCTTLPKGSTGNPYAVRVRYNLVVNGNLVERFLNGKVNSAPATGSSPITLNG